MMMDFLERTLPTLAENLALDEALLLQAEAGQGGEVLRIWEWPTPAVVLGSGCRLTENVKEHTCQDEGVPILRRASGGGTVLLGSGCLLYSLVLPYERSPALRSISSSYRYILEALRKGFLDLVPGLELAGTSDLTVAERKFSGNSQQRKRHWLLHHGTLLHGFDLNLVGRYLHLPIRQPDYRRKRTHFHFLINLPVEAAELKDRLRSIWKATQKRNDWPGETVRQLMEEKYGRSEWIRRR